MEKVDKFVSVEQSAFNRLVKYLSVKHDGKIHGKVGHSISDAMNEYVDKREKEDEKHTK